MEKQNISRYREEIENIHQSMGYSSTPLYDYKEQDINLMNYDGYSEYIKKFNIEQSAIDAIMLAITRSAAYQRTSQKSMMATIGNTIFTEESETVLDESEKMIIIEKIINSIVCAKVVSEEDAEHLKEEAYSKINEIIEIQNSSLTPEEKMQLEEIYKGFEALIQTRQTHMREVADIAKVVSHALGLNADFSYLMGLLHDIGHTWNGHTGERILSAISQLNDCGYIVHNAMGAYILERESIIEDAIKSAKNFSPNTEENELKEFIRYIIDGIVSHNGEGVVGKIIPKDKTSETMSEEIKKCFTEKGFDKKIMPATMEGAIIRYADIIAYTRSDILDGFRLKDVDGNKILNEFDDDYLAIIGTVLARKDNFEELLVFENKFLQEIYGLSERIEELMQKGENISEKDIKELEYSIKEKEMFEEKYEEFKQIKIEYARDYVNSIEPKSKIKTEIPTMMQEVFIKDLVEASKGNDYITMTPLIRKTFFDLRDLNVRKIVPYTRRNFEIDVLPEAANKLIDEYTEELLNVGIAYKAIPNNIKKEIKPAKDYKKYEEPRINMKSNVRFMVRTKMVHYYENLPPKKISYIYENVMNAIEDVTKHDLKIALGEEEYKGELTNLYNEKIKPIKDKIEERGINKENITDEIRVAILEELIKEKQGDIERKIASKMSIEYVGGMTDNTINAVLALEGIMSTKEVLEGYQRAKPGTQKTDKGVEQLQKDFSKTTHLIDEGEVISL